MTPGKQSNSNARTKCLLTEIVQFTCEAPALVNGQPKVHCFPVPRIFKTCPGRPAVEITTLVDIDLKTGEIDVTPEASETHPKARLWRDVTRYPSEDDDA
ncbi:hypothetical protein PLICRDRAFT_37830 [Plicaturopsis crispa FD-325 SS-3]|nr:hypothetical protein PLICRDRAFT_37830 [Plicaturopsis crispa FD-325 SS-3]